MAIGRAKSMGIREAFYMTFSYKEIRLCLAIGKPVSIVTGYGVQQPAPMLKQWRPAASVQQPARGVNRSAVSARQPGMAFSVWRPASRSMDKAPFVPHLFCAPPDFCRPTAVFRSAHSLQKSYPQAQIEGYPIWLWIMRFHQFESCG